jgi:hypothetical protein
MDFTDKRYQRVIEALMKQGFSFISFSDFVLNPSEGTIVLRHDVDALPLNSLKFARIQAALGIRGSYYFRVVPGSWDEDVIMEIAGMGHEVGYHYEDLSFAWAKLKAEGGRQRAKGLRDEETKGLRDTGTKGRRDEGLKGEELEKELVDIAIESFSENLEKLRKIVPVKTICMHGSPLSRWDSRLLWKYYDYRDFGIVGEPYFDVDFDEVMYLTDTGRRWNGEAVSIRDKVQGAGCMVQGGNLFWDWKVKPVQYRKETERRGDEETKRRSDKEDKSSSATVAPSDHRTVIPFPKFHSTSDIIRATENDQLPNKIMMTFHPQRWTDKPVPWAKELVWQNVKNVGKYFLVKMQ